MEDLSRDPIIAFYVKMSKSTEYETKLPVFSETLLRSALIHILGKYRALEASEVELYRKLLLFYYFEKYDSVEDLLEIMPCFKEEDQNECFIQYHDIIHEWTTYSRNQLTVYLHKEAFNELLYEWIRRYLQMFGQVPKDQLYIQARAVQRFLCQHEKFLKPWLRSFEALLPARQSSDTDELQPMTADDLKVAKIFADLKSKINPIVFEEVSNKPTYDEDCEYIEPPKKKNKKKRIEMLDIQILKEEVEVELVNKSIQHGALEADPINVQESIVEDGNEKSLEDCEQEEVNDDDKIVLIDIADSEDSQNSRNPSDEPEVSQEHAEEDTSRSRIITHDTALKYLSELQAYAVINGHSNAFGLLDEVDTIFRADC